MKKLTIFLSLWLVNSALIYLANSFLPANYALGNDIFTPLQAAMFTGLVLNWIIWNVEKQLKEFEIKLEGQMQMMLAYLLVNFASLWIFARLAFIFGFGVISFVWVFALALVANFAQYFVWSYLSKKK